MSWWCWARPSSTSLPRPAQSSPTDWAAGRVLRCARGLAAVADADVAVLHLVDTPDVGADVVARVLAAARASSSGLARATYDGRPGHPVVVAREHWLGVGVDPARRRGRAEVPGGPRRRAGRRMRRPRHGRGRRPALEQAQRGDRGALVGQFGDRRVDARPGELVDVEPLDDLPRAVDRAHRQARSPLPRGCRRPPVTAAPPTSSRRGRCRRPSRGRGRSPRWPPMRPTTCRALR